MDKKLSAKIGLTISLIVINLIIYSNKGMADSAKDEKASAGNKLLLADFNNGTAKNNLQETNSVWVQAPAIITPVYDHKTSPYEGKYCLKIDYDTKITGGGAWILNTGILNVSGYEKFVFWIKGKEGGENFTVEFKDSGLVQSKINIDNFIDDVTTEWQKVSIPIDVFAENNPEIDLEELIVFAVVWWQEYNLPVKGTIYLDKIMLTGRKKMKKADKAANLLLVHDFNSGDVQNNLGGNAYIWQDTDVVCSVDYKDTSGPKEGNYSLKIKYDIPEDGNKGCGWFTYSDSLDLSSYKNLVFWARGKDGDEEFAVLLSSPDKENKSTVRIENYLEDGITKKWQEVIIPLQDFINNGKEGFDIRNISCVFGILWWGQKTSGTIFIDKIFFEPKEGAKLDQVAKGGVYNYDTGKFYEGDEITQKELDEKKPKIKEGKQGKKYNSYKNIPYLGRKRKEKMDIFIPISKEKKKCPAVLIIHGGGWQGGDKSDTRGTAIKLAENGYAVFNINYLLYRKKNRKRGVKWQPSWPQMAYDCKSALRFIRKFADYYKIDKENIATMGWSAGGHLALLLAVSSDNKELNKGGLYKEQNTDVQCVVNIFGVPDIRIWGGGSKGAFINSMKKDPNPWNLSSPITQITKETPPIITIHGDKDFVVPYKESEKLDKELKAKGVEHVFVTVPGAGHGFSLFKPDKSNNYMNLGAEIFKFLDKHLNE